MRLNRVDKLKLNAVVPLEVEIVNEMSVLIFTRQTAQTYDRQTGVEMKQKSPSPPRYPRDMGHLALLDSYCTSLFAGRHLTQ